MIYLYQFPISHFCEKVRWALDHKKLEYKACNLLPGFHRKKVMAIAPKSAVPVIVDKGIVVSNSSKIISYLDEKYPDASLTPEDEKLRQESLEWEEYADTVIGPAVRCLCYQTLLEHPKLVGSFLTAGMAWHNSLLLKLVFPRLKEKMKKYMAINEDTAEKSRLKIIEGLNRIEKHLEGKQFLVGDSFTRADLAVASLLAPLFGPENFGLDFPERYPEPLGGIVEEFGDKLDWVRSLYISHR